MCEKQTMKSGHGLILLLSAIGLLTLVQAASHIVRNEEQNEKVVITPNCTVEKDVDHVNKAKMIMERSQTLWESSPILRKEDCIFKCAHKSGCTHAAYSNVTLKCTLLSHSQAKIKSEKELEKLPVYTSIVKVTCFDDQYCLNNPDSPICSGTVIDEQLKALKASPIPAKLRHKREVRNSETTPSVGEVTKANITECLNDTLTITMYCCWTEAFDATCPIKKSVITFDRFQTKNSCVYQCAASGQCTAAVYDQNKKQCRLYIGTEHCSAEVNTPELKSSVLLSAKCNRDHQPVCGKDVTTTEASTTPAPCGPMHFIDMSDIEDNMIIEPNGTVHYNKSLGVLRIDFDSPMPLSRIEVNREGQLKNTSQLNVEFDIEGFGKIGPKILKDGNNTHNRTDVSSLQIMTQDGSEINEQTTFLVENCGDATSSNNPPVEVEATGASLSQSETTELRTTSEPKKMCYICLKGENFANEDIFKIADGSAAEIDDEGVLSIAFNNPQELQMIWAKTVKDGYNVFAKIYENNELLSEIPLTTSDSTLARTMVLASDAKITKAEIYVKQVQDSNSTSKRKDVLGIIDEVCTDSCLQSSQPIVTTFATEPPKTETTSEGVCSNYEITEKMFEESSDGLITFPDKTEAEVDNALYVTFSKPKTIYSVRATIKNCDIRLQVQLTDLLNETKHKAVNCKEGEEAVTTFDDLVGPFNTATFGLTSNTTFLTTSTITAITIVVCEKEEGTTTTTTTSTSTTTAVSEETTTPQVNNTCNDLEFDGESFITDDVIEYPNDVTARLTKRQNLAIDIPHSAEVLSIGLQKDLQEPNFQVTLIKADENGNSVPVVLNSAKDSINQTDMTPFKFPVKKLVFVKEGEGGIHPSDFTRLVIVICKYVTKPTKPSELMHETNQPTNEVVTTESQEESPSTPEPATSTFSTTTTEETSTTSTSTTTEEPTTTSTSSTTTTSTTEEPTTSTSTTTTEEPTSTTSTSTSTSTTEEPTSTSSTTTTEESTSTSSTSTSTTEEPTTTSTSTTTEEPTSTSTSTTTEEPTSTSTSTTTEESTSTSTSTTTEEPTSTTSTSTSTSTTTEEPTTTSTTSTSTTSTSTTTTEAPTTEMVEPECLLEDDPCSLITVIHKEKGAMKFSICGDHGKCISYGDSTTGRSFECECLGSYTGERCNVCDTCENPSNQTSHMKNNVNDEAVKTSTENESNDVSTQLSSEGSGLLKNETMDEIPISEAKDEQEEEETATEQVETATEQAEETITESNKESTSSESELSSDNENAEFNNETITSDQAWSTESSEEVTPESDNGLSKNETVAATDRSIEAAATAKNATVNEKPEIVSESAQEAVSDMVDGDESSEED